MIRIDIYRVIQEHVSLILMVHIHMLCTIIFLLFNSLFMVLVVVTTTTTTITISRRPTVVCERC